jgi:low affinity Fe/Cu permease
MSIRNRIEDAFALLAGKVATATGSFWAFGFACAVIVVWAPWISRLMNRMKTTTKPSRE